MSLLVLYLLKVGSPYYCARRIFPRLQAIRQSLSLLAWPFQLHAFLLYSNLMDWRRFTCFGYLSKAPSSAPPAPKRSLLFLYWFSNLCPVLQLKWSLCFLFDVILTKLLDRMIEFSTEEQNFERVREEEESIHSLCFKPN